MYVTNMLKIYLENYSKLLRKSSRERISDGHKIDTFLLFTVDLELLPNDIRYYKSKSRCKKELLFYYKTLIDILNKYNIKGAFFVDGKNCIEFPELIKDLYADKHEIGAHGFYHESIVSFWPISRRSMPKYCPLDKRVYYIRSSKNIIRRIIGVNPLCFRAPYLAIDGKTLKLLENEGFLLDSSLYNPAFGRLSYPYHPSVVDPASGGELKLLEIPITVSPIPQRKYIYWRYPHIFELEEKEIKKTINLVRTAFIQSGCAFALFVTLIHPYELRSAKVISRVLTFLEVMKNIGAVSLTASHLVKRYKLPNYR